MQAYGIFGLFLRTYLYMYIVTEYMVTSYMCLQLIVLCVLRKCFDFIFTQRELFWLDHTLPDEYRRRREDREREEKEVCMTTNDVTTYFRCCGDM